MISTAGQSRGSGRHSPVHSWFFPVGMTSVSRRYYVGVGRTQRPDFVNHSDLVSEALFTQTICQQVETQNERQQRNRRSQNRMRIEREQTATGIDGRPPIRAFRFKPQTKE